MVMTFDLIEIETFHPAGKRLGRKRLRTLPGAPGKLLPPVRLGTEQRQLAQKIRLVLILPSVFSIPDDAAQARIRPAQGRHARRQGFRIRQALVSLVEALTNRSPS